MKELEFGKFERTMQAFNETAEAVAGTLGPKGMCVLIGDPMMPNLTNDGHTVANSISYSDNFKELGAWLVKATSSKTNDDVGDATTTTAVLLQEIVNRSLERPENPMLIKSSLQEACKAIVEKIKAQSTPIGIEDIKKVALISSENEEIATLVTDIINKVGKDGVIVVEESRTYETSSEVLEGYEAQAGFANPVFVNDETKAKAVYDNVAVFCSQKRISSVGDIKTLFDILQDKKIGSIVIVCEDIDDSLLGVMALTKAQGTMGILVIKTNSTTLEDIAASVGAKIVSDSTGYTFQNVTTETLGQAKKVISSQKKTLFVAETEEGKAHAERLKALADNNQNQFQKEELLKRVAQLTGGIGVIRIGAGADLDRGYKKDKTDDTVAAVKAALEEGIVEGGGMCLWRIAQEMTPKTVGEEILKQALVAPLKRICKNAGVDYAEIVNKMPTGTGYDAKNNTYVNMLEAGIVDPAKSMRSALENSTSNGSTFITTSCCIVDEAKK